ncbi:MAG: alpha-amylase [Gammaproteobacteria bacterium]|nr:MAG: alpha-amylase [Gammaproteobacteria bacterium]
MSSGDPCGDVEQQVDHPRCLARDPGKPDLQPGMVRLQPPLQRRQVLPQVPARCQEIGQDDQPRDPLRDQTGDHLRGGGGGQLEEGVAHRVEAAAGAAGEPFRELRDRLVRLRLAAAMGEQQQGSHGLSCRHGNDRPESQMTGPVSLPPQEIAALERHLIHIYGDAHALEPLLGKLRSHLALHPPRPRPHWSNRDILLITYGDTVLSPDIPPLKSLHRWLSRRVGKAVNGVHLLPFFPYSSDDGFSVIDYRRVNPELGDWDDIHALAGEYRLMVDLVLNHVSRQSLWFHDFLNDVEPYRHFFIEVDPDADLSKVVRPRSTPLVTEVQTHQGYRYLWTTFSDDQIDLNYANPAVLLEMIDIMLFYVTQGARYLRLDAVPYLWKEPGTTCFNLPRTHELVRLFNRALRIAAPHVSLLVEANVPHRENIRYFGDGNEAHMVYQFALPPLILHTLNRADSSRLTAWARRLEPPPAGCTFLNFTASHDGIGLRPVERILPRRDLQDLIDSMRRFGGFVSFRSDGGDEVPYEINISWFDAMAGTRRGGDTLQVERCLCSQAIMLALQGVPAVYVHVLTGTPNAFDLVESTGHTRSINRRKWQVGELDTLLDNRASLQSRVFRGMQKLLRIRREAEAMDPEVPQEVLDLGPALFAVLRRARWCRQEVLALHNVTLRPVLVDGAALAETVSDEGWHDLATGEPVALSGLEVRPCRYRWLGRVTPGTFSGPDQSLSSSTRE